MKDITTREDIALLVRSFYAKVRKNELLGPVFNSVITDWENHFEHLTDFWQSNLFFKKTYHGDPIQKHVEVDQGWKGGINELHFGVWLNIWYQTIDVLFEGETAQIAKNRARTMSTFMNLKIFESRANSSSRK